jgi:hypothetical protein
LQAYGSAFDGPHWKSNLLWVTLCHLIPMVGPLVFLGYFYEVIELNSKQPGIPNPQFTFQRFTDYLVRGVWPFVIQLILQFIIQLPLMAVYFAFVIPLMFVMKSLGPPTGPLIFGLGIGVFMLIVMCFAMCLGLLLMPILLRAGLSQDFVQAFKFRWIIDFNRRVGFDVFLVMLFMICTAVPLVYLGELMCIVGIFPAITITQLAGANLTWQLYNLYLARGGEPVPLKPPPPAAPLPAVGQNKEPPDEQRPLQSLPAPNPS